MPRSKAKLRAAKRSAKTPPVRGDIRTLFSFQLQRLAGLSTRIASLTIRPKFGITPREWRALAVLSYLDEAPLNELARHSGLLKSQMSRTVSGLIGRGLIERADNPEDGRSLLLRLSPKGAKITDRILFESQARNARMLAALSETERRALMGLVARVFDTSFAFYAELKSSGAKAEPDED